MTEKIRTRVFNYGNEKESTWPPLFGTGGSGLYHYSDGKLVEGPPPQRIQKFGEAPSVIQDTLPEWHYHQGACRWTNSRSEINQMDAATGCITTGGRIDTTPMQKSRERRIAEERKRDQETAMQKAIAAIDSGNAPMSEETRALCEEQNEIVSKALNFDAYNVAGRKDNAKGKRFRRK